MTDFLNFLETYRDGIWILILCLAALVLLIQWLSWIFSKGRFKRTDAAPRRQDSIRYVFSDAVVKVVNDFRHLLALIIVVIFAIALAYSLWQAGKDLNNIKEALTAVTATLGGLVGSIIGYYFGESSATKPPTTGIPVARQQDPTTATQGVVGAQGTDAGQVPPITRAPGLPAGMNPAGTTADPTPSGGDSPTQPDSPSPTSETPPPTGGS